MSSVSVMNSDIPWDAVGMPPDPRNKCLVDSTIAVMGFRMSSHWNFSGTAERGKIIGVAYIHTCIMNWDK